MKKTILILLCLWGYLDVRPQTITGLEFESPHVIAEPNDYFQMFIGTGGSVSYYNKYAELSEDEKAKALQWIAGDINLKFAKNYIDNYPEDDPDEFEPSAEFWNDIKSVNPHVNFQLCVNNLPNRYRLENGDHYDPAYTNILDSLADYYFKSIEYYHNAGVTVDQLDLLNEQGYDDKYLDLFGEGVDKLRAIIDDPEKNPSGVPMPLIVGPSTWSTKSPWDKWLPAFKADGHAWENLDIVSTHGYENGTLANYQAVAQAAEGKPFYNNEQTGKIQSDEGTGGDAVDDLARQWESGEEPEYIGDVSMAMRMSDLINGGGNSFFVFRVNNDKGNNAALVGMNNGEAFKSKIYEGARHISSVQPDSSYRVRRTAFQADKYRVVTMRKPGEDTLYVHVTNVWGDLGTLLIGAAIDGSSAYGIKAVQGWTSDEFLEFELTVDDTYEQSVNALQMEITPHSVNSYKITLDPDGFEVQKQEQEVTFDAIEDQEVGTTITLAASSTSNLTVNYEIIEGNVTLSGDELTLNGAGPVIIRAVQSGNESYFLDSEVREFCVNPVVPTISRQDDVLTSSADQGNIWLLNGNIIENETGKTYEVTTQGYYSVMLDEGGCMAVSDELFVKLEAVVLDAPSANGASFVHFNQGILSVHIPDNRSIVRVEMFNLPGQSQSGSLEISGNQAFMRTTGNGPGLYLVRVMDDKRQVYTHKLFLN